MAKEKWLPIVGYEGRYEISNRGRVRSLLFHPHRMLRFDLSGAGYPRVTIAHFMQPKRFLVHHLVMEAFVGPRPPTLEVNHENGKKTDNSLGNLKYVTRSENIKHAFRVLGKKSACGPPRGSKRLKPWQVKNIRKMRERGATLMFIAKRHKCCTGTVSLIVNGKVWRHV